MTGKILGNQEDLMYGDGENAYNNMSLLQEVEKIRGIFHKSMVYFGVVSEPRE